MDKLEQFKELCDLADKLIGQLSKDQLAEATRLLALHVAQYAQRYGDMPSKNLLELLGSADLTGEQTELLHNGMEILVSYLGTVRQMGEERAKRLSAGADTGFSGGHR